MKKGKEIVLIHNDDLETQKLSQTINDNFEIHQDLEEIKETLSDEDENETNKIDSELIEPRLFNLVNENKIEEIEEKR